MLLCSMFLTSAGSLREAVLRRVHAQLNTLQQLRDAKVGSQSRRWLLDPYLAQSLLSFQWVAGPSSLPQWKTLQTRHKMSCSAQQPIEVMV